MDALYPRIFMYLKLRVPGQRSVRTKIREFRAFDRALTDILQKLQEIDPEGAWDLSETVVEYVDANTNQTLVKFFALNNDLCVQGRIPAEYQDRMLNGQGHLAIAWHGTDGADSFSILQRIRENLKNGAEEFKFVIRGRPKID